MPRSPPPNAPPHHDDPPPPKLHLPTPRPPIINNNNNGNQQRPTISPLRDGNRDRLIGLLTERAAKTLLVYLMELSPPAYAFMLEFCARHPIPRSGPWDDVSGEAFLRALLALPPGEAVVGGARAQLFGGAPVGVDPRRCVRCVCLLCVCCVSAVCAAC